MMLEEEDYPSLSVVEVDDDLILPTRDGEIGGASGRSPFNFLR